MVAMLQVVWMLSFALRPPGRKQLTRCFSAQLMQDMLYRIRQVHRPPSVPLLDFRVDGTSIGRVHPDIAAHLIEAGPSVFQRDSETTLTLSKDAGSTCESRSEAVASVTDRLREQGHFPGWRDELYPIAPSFYDDPVFLMERATVPWIGAVEYGVHVNGLVDDEMWIARRSATKSKYPGMLDQIVAGGQPAGLSLYENVLKECDEEAGIPAEIARAGLQAVGAVSYATYNEELKTLTRAVLFNYDLKLPNEFVPKPVDGEVQEFFRWSLPQILESMAPDYEDPIKPNCYTCIIDWLLRTGKISPDTPGYLDVLRELRSGDCQ